jgi:nucleotide-binding universal stress UspA family protein
MDVDPLNTILLAIGPRDDDRVGRLAGTVLQVAAPTGATVVLAHVFTDEQYEQTVSDLGYDSTAEVVVEDVLARHETVLRYEELFDDAGVDWRVRGVVGDVSDGVIELADATDADRVVVSGRRRSPAGKAVFGSVAQDVLLGAPCPVTYVRGD